MRNRDPFAGGYIKCKLPQCDRHFIRGFREHRTFTLTFSKALLFYMPPPHSPSVQNPSFGHFGCSWPFRVCEFNISRLIMYVLLVAVCSLPCMLKMELGTLGVKTNYMWVSPRFPPSTTSFFLSHFAVASRPQ